MGGIMLPPRTKALPFLRDLASVKNYPRARPFFFNLQVVDPSLFKHSAQLVLVPSVGCLARGAYPVHAYKGDWRSSLVMEESFTLRDVFHWDFNLESLCNRQVVASST